MKRSSVIIFCFGILFLSVFSGYSQKNTGTPGAINLKGNIRYHVKVNLSNEIALCHTYLVQIQDGNHQMVTPSKIYYPGVTDYTLYEAGPVAGVRTAVLIRAGYNTSVCTQQLFTAPDVKSGIFKRDQSYYYQLNPKFEFPNIIH